MPRYFIEVSYKGTNYSGFQIQQNANSIQAEIENAFKIFFKKKFELTGSSRTDAGVHALQNFFHFDSDKKLIFEKDFRYNLNALLSGDIVIKNIFLVKDFAHSRFDAVSREYKYFIYQKRDPFLQEIAFYYPYKIDIKQMNEAAQQIINFKDFSSFSKKNTQVNNFNCNIFKSEWNIDNEKLVYNV
ncbi:MAG: tRNA pseudouridine synthase A, partial [Ginsengibacter sp.]